ncbi:MAG: hypothetical protein JWO12_1584, partial [Frankiales bacterium]|nr:hypothetical protein [Frankiales bacterium]
DSGYQLTVHSRLGKGSEFALDFPVSPDKPARAKK